MKSVFLMIDKEKNVVAIYDTESVALKMKKPIEDKLKVELTIDKRSVNLELGTIGVFK